MKAVSPVSMIAAIVLAILVIFTADILILRAREAGLQVLEPLKVLAESFGVLVGESSRRTPVENAVLCTYAICKYGCNSVDFAKYGGLEFDGYIYDAGRRIDINSCSQLCEVYRNKDMFYDRENERFCNYIDDQKHSDIRLILELDSLAPEAKKIRKKVVIEDFTNEIWCMANSIDIGVPPNFNFIQNNNVGNLKEKENCKQGIMEQTSYNLLEINKNQIKIETARKLIPRVGYKYYIQIYP